jgi:hypothetical protein
MKRGLLLLILILTFNFTFGQRTKRVPDASTYNSLFEGSKGSQKFRSELRSDIDPTWDKWSLRGYNFGFDTNQTPMYTTVNGILSTPYMIQVRGNDVEKNKKRWGYHVFEGYATDDKSRITLLVNKHIENEKPVAEMYYYGTEYDHSALAYNWFRIGSDVRQHSFLFSRDKAIFYGSLKLSNTLTLGGLGKDNVSKEPPPGDHERYYEESAKHVNYEALKNSENGTIFYDKDNNIVVIKMNGSWMKLAVEPLPDHIKYEFE